MQHHLPTGIPGASGNKDLLKQADAIWKMLDEMSENDPDSYKRFIEQQLSQGKEHFASNSPSLCARINANAFGHVSVLSYALFSYAP